MSGRALTADYVRSLLHYEEDTGEFYWRVTRGAKAKAGAIAGRNNRGVVGVMIDGRTYLAGNLAWLVTHGVWPDDDHSIRRRTLTESRAQFLAKMAETNENGCKLWTGRCRGFGYGQLRIDGKGESTHRAAWRLFVGPIPDGMHVLHKCDVPACVNIDHLFLGTHADNVADMDRKGRRGRPRRAA